MLGHVKTVAEPHVKMDVKIRAKELLVKHVNLDVVQIVMRLVLKQMQTARVVQMHANPTVVQVHVH